MIFTEVLADQRYESGTVVLQREEGLTPNGNQIGGRWVLRVNGAWIDCDTYRVDVCERNGYTLPL